MTIEEESVQFLQDRIDSDFSDLLSHFTIKEIEWLGDVFTEDETLEEIRPIAFLNDEEGNKSNLICLFPPFTPTEEIK